MFEHIVHQTAEETGLKDSSVRLLIEHGQRQGYLSYSDLLDCVPEVEYDEDLMETVLEAIAKAGIPYYEGKDLEEEEQNEVENENEEEDLSDAIKVTELGPVDLEGVETDDMIGLYLREAARVPLLSADEEVELAKRIERGREAGKEFVKEGISEQRKEELEEQIEQCRQAREHLIRANARLVISIAKKYMGRGLPFLDLIQEGNIGLMRAVRKYDYTRGFKFSTYATYWIRQAVTRSLADQSRTIRLPVYMSDQVNRMVREQAALHQKLGRRPTNEELGEVLDLEPEKVEEMKKIIRRPLSLQTPVGEDDEEVLGDFIEDIESADPEESTMQVLMNEDLLTRLKILPPRELQVLELRYGLSSEEPMTLSAIGRKMGITRERVRQLETQALKRLRNPEEQDQRTRRRKKQ